jgi:hypothetical protein
MKEKCNCKQKCSCGEKWKQEYECYLAEQKCIEEKKLEEEMKKSDNTYGLNPIACEQTRDIVYLNYTGRDRFKWFGE